MSILYTTNVPMNNTYVCCSGSFTNILRMNFQKNSEYTEKYLLASEICSDAKRLYNKNSSSEDINPSTKGTHSPSRNAMRYVLVKFSLNTFSKYLCNFIMALYSSIFWSKTYDRLYVKTPKNIKYIAIIMYK